jgi:hypothetical protein
MTDNTLARYEIVSRYMSNQTDAEWDHLVRTVSLKLDRNQLATTLAALRLLQDDLVYNPDRVDSLPHFDDAQCLCLVEVDELCNALNRTR